MHPHRYHRTSTALVSLALALISGCRVVHEARLVQQGDNPHPGEIVVSSSDMGLNTSAACSLSNLVATALLYHPSIVQARHAVEAARLQCNIVRADYIPQISASGSYSRSTRNVRGRSTSSKTQGNWSGRVGLDFLLYDFGRLAARDQQSLSHLLAAEEQLRNQEIEVAYNIRNAFFEQHRTTELLRVAEESLQLYAEHLEEARTMVEVGTRRQYDYTKAEVDWGNATLEVITSSNNLINAHAQLARHLGLTEYLPLELTPDLLPPPDSIDPDELLAQARLNSPALAILHAQEQASSAALDEAIAALYPELKLGGDFTASGRDFPLTPNFSGAVNLLQTLFDGPRRADRIRIAVTDLRTARARIADAEQELFLSLVNAVSHYQSASQRLETAHLIARQAAENSELVNEQFRVGLSSSIERTDAQVAVTRAQADLVRARYDAQTAQALISRLIGKE